MNKVACPRCGVYMDLLAESENASGEKVIRYFYKCPACGYRLPSSTIRIRKQNDSEILLSIAK
ncbi:MAG: hypothetical protein ACP5HQ_06465 [Thermoprotei archaeon]